MAGLWVVIQVSTTYICMVQCTHLITTGGTLHLYNRGSSILEKIICNFTNGVQILLYSNIQLFFFFMNNTYSVLFWLIGHQRSLSAQVNGGPDTTSDRWKQPFSAVRVSGGCPADQISRHPVSSEYMQGPVKIPHKNTNLWLIFVGAV